MYALMDLDADGVVTRAFMPNDQLEQYRGAGGVTPAAAAYDHDPNLPKTFDELGLAPNDFDAGGFTYDYPSGRDAVPELSIAFLARRTALQYLGYNEQGSWLVGDNLDNMRLYTFRGDVHVPYECGNTAPCISGGQLTRQPYSVALPKNLRNMPADVRADMARMPYGKGPNAAEEVAETARRRAIDDAYKAWSEQLDKVCGPAPEKLALALAHGPYVKTSDALVACRTSKSRERAALYERATAEVTAKNVAPATWKEVGAP